MRAPPETLVNSTNIRTGTRQVPGQREDTDDDNDGFIDDDDGCNFLPIQRRTGRLHDSDGDAGRRRFLELVQRQQLPDPSQWSDSDDSGDNPNGT